MEGALIRVSEERGDSYSRRRLLWIVPQQLRHPLVLGALRVLTVS